MDCAKVTGPQLQSQGARMAWHDTLYPPCTGTGRHPSDQLGCACRVTSTAKLLSVSLHQQASCCAPSKVNALPITAGQVTPTFSCMCPKIGPPATYFCPHSNFRISTKSVVFETTTGAVCLRCIPCQACLASQRSALHHVMLSVVHDVGCKGAGMLASVSL